MLSLTAVQGSSNLTSGMAHHKLALLALLVVLYVAGTYAWEEECKTIPRWGLCKPHSEEGEAKVMTKK